MPQRHSTVAVARTRPTCDSAWWWVVCASSSCAACRSVNRFGWCTPYSRCRESKAVALHVHLHRDRVSKAWRIQLPRRLQTGWEPHTSSSDHHHHHRIHPLIHLPLTSACSLFNTISRHPSQTCAHTSPITDTRAHQGHHHHDHSHHHHHDTTSTIAPPTCLTMCEAPRARVTQASAVSYAKSNKCRSTHPSVDGGMCGSVVGSSGSTSICHIGMSNAPRLPLINHVSPSWYLCVQSAWVCMWVSGLVGESVGP